MSIFKRGYTLAEVLITLAIIGTIAAITIPSLQINAQKAQVVPALQKAMNTLENFNNTILYENNARSLRSYCGFEMGGGYLKKLAEDGLLSKTPNIPYVLVDGIKQGFAGHYVSQDGIMFMAQNSSNVVQSFKDINGIRYYEIYVDINGEKGPNILGKDVFMFLVNSIDGSVTSIGAMNLSTIPRPNGGGYQKIADTWEEKCANNQDPVDARYCTAAIVENDWHIRYNY